MAFIFTRRSPILAGLHLADHRIWEDVRMKKLIGALGILTLTAVVGCGPNMQQINESSDKAEASATRAEAAAKSAEDAAAQAEAAAKKAEEAAAGAEDAVHKANDAVARLEAAFATSVTK
jgi:hypothetical protein